MSDLENFRSLGLSEITLDALRAKGFEEPSPIQAKTIPLLISGEKDLIGQAQTGTGKTAAFGLPVLEVIHGGSLQPQALILSPTRELCLQIAEELNSLKGTRNISIIPLYGGQPIEIQLKALKRGVDVAVGTPGRIMDLMERGALVLDDLKFAILDEADEMLNMGFVEDIEEIKRDIDFIYLHKTADLFIASAAMGALAVGADEKLVGKLKEYALNLGLAFQYQDDLLDGDSPYDLEKTRSLAEESTNKAIDALQGLPGDVSELIRLAESLRGRQR